MAAIENLRIAAMNRHRKRTFGDAILKLFETTPVDGETEIIELEADWFGQRLNGTTDGAGSGSASEWQFQAIANDDWESSQDEYLKTTVLTVDNRRWKVRKVEKPLPGSLVWKFRAIEQK